MRAFSVFRITVFLYAFVLLTVQQPVAKASVPSIVLPEGYNNDDIVVLYNDLKKKYPEKDEFETKEAYQKRMQVPYSKEIVLFVKNNDVLIRWDKYYTRYDAENQVLSLKKFLYKSEIKIKRTKFSENKYKGVSGFGVKTIVSSYRGEDYGIYVMNDKYVNKDIEIQISPDKAKELKKNLGILFVCDLKNHDQKAYVKKESYYKSPTFTSPTKYDFSEYYVFVDVIEMVIFNNKTGTVYVKKVFEVEDDYEW